MDRQDKGRQVLISFLGTGNYAPVIYTWNVGNIKGKKCTRHKTKFVQEAIATKLCGSWTENDCIMVFRTEQSNAKNWLDTKVSKPDGTGEEKIQGLESTLRSIRLNNGNKLKCRINPEPEGSENADSYIIPTGLDQIQEEMEEIFNQVFSKLDKKDEIYFDVTHAFRTIPLFATVLFNYAHFLKETSLKGIFYGAYEKLNTTTQEAPIVDLIDIVRLQEINSAAASFRDFGNMKAFSNLLLGNKDMDENIKNISNALTQLDGYIQSCQLDAIKKGDYISVIERSINGFKSSNHTNDAQCNLLDTILIRLKDDFKFEGRSSYANIEAAIDWAIEYNMIQQAFTMAQEYIITRAYDRMVDLGLKDEIERSIHGDSRNLTYLLRKKLGDALATTDILGKFPEVYQLSVKCQEMFNGKMAKEFGALRILRNSLNHANTANNDPRSNKGPRSYDDYKNELKYLWDSCKEIIHPHND